MYLRFSASTPTRKHASQDLHMEVEKSLCQVLNRQDLLSDIPGLESYNVLHIEVHELIHTVIDLQLADCFKTTPFW